MEVLTWFSIEN